MILQCVQKSRESGEKVQIRCTVVIHASTVNAEELSRSYPG